MEKGKMFEYAVLYHGKGVTSVIVEKTTVVVRSEREAKILAARAIPKEYENQLEDVEIIARPFV